MKRKIILAAFLIGMVYIAFFGQNLISDLFNSHSLSETENVPILSNVTDDTTNVIERVNAMPSGESMTITSEEADIIRRAAKPYNDYVSQKYNLEK